MYIVHFSNSPLSTAITSFYPSFTKYLLLSYQISLSHLPLSSLVHLHAHNPTSVVGRIALLIEPSLSCILVGYQKLTRSRRLVPDYVHSTKSRAAVWYTQCCKSRISALFKLNGSLEHSRDISIIEIPLLFSNHSFLVRFAMMRRGSGGIFHCVRMDLVRLPEQIIQTRSTLVIIPP